MLITNGSYAAHVKGECSIEMSTTMNISEVMTQPINSPLTQIEKELQTSLAKRSLATSPDNVIRMKTGGQVSKTCQLEEVFL